MPAPSRDRLDDQSIAREIARLVGMTMGKALQAAARSDAAVPALTLARVAESIGARRLAAAHPGAAAQRDALALYDRCLAHYRSAIQPRFTRATDQDDLSPAAAYFLLANLAASGAEEPDQDGFEALAAQLGRLSRAPKPGSARRSPSGRPGSNSSRCSACSSTNRASRPARKGWPRRPTSSALRAAT